jgi:hypothetical protein
MVARALVSDGTIYDHEIGWWLAHSNLTGRSEANYQATIASEKLLCDEHGIGSTNYTANNSDYLAGEEKRVEVGVITSPIFKSLCFAGGN